MRENGLQRPYSGMQLATWILHPILVAQFVIFCRPLFPLYVWIPLTSVFGIFAIISVTFAYMTSKINPMDDRLFQQLLGYPSPRSKGNHGNTNSNNSSGNSTTSSPSKVTNNKKKKKKNIITVNPDHTKYCWVCEAHVHVFSMHCKFCDKCVGRFDHHCLWLNTCVGSANYNYFFRTVWSTLLLSLIHFISLVFVVVLYFMNYWGFKQRAKEWFGLNQPAIVIGVNIAFLPITLGAIMLLVQLWTFHLGIQWEGITTYQYIVRFNARKRDQTRLEDEIQNKRVSAIQRAVGEGKSMLACRLRMGPFCRPCDSIRQSVMSNYDQQILQPHGSYQGGSNQDDNDPDDGNDDNDVDEQQLNKLEKGIATRESRYDKHSRNGEKDSSPNSGTLRLEQKTPPQSSSNNHQRKNSIRPYDERDEISLEENKPPSRTEDNVIETLQKQVEYATFISYPDQMGVEVSTDVSNGEDRDGIMNTGKGSWNYQAETRVDTDDSVPRTIFCVDTMTDSFSNKPKIANDDENLRQKTTFEIPTPLEVGNPRSVSSTPAKNESSHYYPVLSRTYSGKSIKSDSSIPHFIKIPLFRKEMSSDAAEISPTTVLQDIYVQSNPRQQFFAHQSV